MESIYKDYKDGAAHQRITGWCEDRLSRWTYPHTRQVWDSLAGPTHLLLSGDDRSGHTVVFVPGMSFCAAASLPEIEILSTEHRVITLDVPGEPGLSGDRRVQDARMNQLGAWLTEIVDRLDRPVIVVGHSLGAAVSMSATSSRIAGRVLVSPAGIRRLRTPLGLLWSSLAWLTRSNAVTSQRLLQHMSGVGQAPTREQVEWKALVGRWVRTGLAPGPLPVEVIRKASTSPCVVATGQCDVFLPPDRLRGRVRELLATEVHTLSCGHLLDEEAWAHVSNFAAQM